MYKIIKIAYFLFSVPITICHTNVITTELLESVFGVPDSMSSPSALQQAVPVAPQADDPDYEESDDKYVPAVVDYDKFDWTLTKVMGFIDISYIQAAI